MKQFEWNFARNCVINGFFQNNSVENSLICPRTKSASHCLTELFPIYQNKHWTIRRQDDNSLDPSSHSIILTIVGFQDCLKQFMLAAVIFVMDVALLSLLPMYIHRHFLTERIVHNGATLLVCYEKWALEQGLGLIR